MSYSFTFRAPTAEQALAEASRRLDQEIVSQPEHRYDREVALANLRQHFELFNDHFDPERNEFTVSMNGGITGDFADGAFRSLQSAGSGCAIGMLTRTPAAAPAPAASAEEQAVDNMVAPRK